MMKNYQKINNKVKYILPMLLLVFSIAGAQNSQEIPKRYEIKSAKITYTENSPEGKGTKVLFFDQYGMRESAHITLKKRNKIVKDQIVILNGEKSYMIDLLTNTGEDISGGVRSAMGIGKLGGNDMSKTGKQMLQSMGGTKLGYQNFLGKNCEKWAVHMMGKTTMLLWKGVLLRSESKIIGISSVEEASSITTGQHFTNADFEPPAGVEIKQNEMQGMESGVPKMNDEDRQQMKKMMNMSYADFKKMMKKDNPNLSDDEIKQTYDMMHKLGNLFK